jgi:hypothetical protein
VQELALLGDLDRHVAGEQLGHRGVGCSGPLVRVHRLGGRIADRAGGGHLRRHAPELVLGELELRDRGAELLAVHHVAGGLLERGLGQTGGPSAGLQPPRGEAAHLQVEATAEPLLAAHQVLGRHEPALEVEREGVHAAVARRGIRLADQAAAAGLLELEGVTEVARLGHDEEREPARARGRVRVGAQQHRQHVGPPREGAPGLRPADAPALDTVQRGALGAALRARNVAPDVGLRDADADHQLAARDPGQPVRLLLVGAAGQQRLGQDFGARDERAGPRERGARELLGRDHHGDVAHLAAAVLLRHRKPEVPELAHLLDEGLGNDLVVAVDTLGVRADLGLGEFAHRVARELVDLLERTVVAAAPLGRRAPDRAHPILMQRLTHEVAHLGSRQVRVREPVGVGVIEHQVAGARAHLTGEHGRHLLVQGPGFRGVRVQIARGAQHRGQVGQPLDRDLLLVDVTSCRVGGCGRDHALGVLERLLDDLGRNRAGLTHGGRVTRLPAEGPAAA